MIYKRWFLLGFLVFLGLGYWFMHRPVITEKEIPVLEIEQSEFAQNVSKLLNYIKSRGYHVTLGEAYRTPEQAKIDEKQGKGILNSLHCKRLAIDLNLFDSKGKYLGSNKDYKFAGDYWESLHPHNRWGGNFIKDGGHINDPDHFERKI